MWGKEKNGPEDLLTGRAMTRIGIDTQRNVDGSGAQLFLPLGPNSEYNAKTQASARRVTPAHRTRLFTNAHRLDCPARWQTLALAVAVARACAPACMAMRPFNFPSMLGAAPCVCTGSAHAATLCCTSATAATRESGSMLSTHTHVHPCASAPCPRFGFRAVDVLLTLRTIPSCCNTVPPASPHTHMLFFCNCVHVQSKSFWFWRLSVDARAGPTCCAPQWIGSHYVKPAQMHIMDDMASTWCEADTTLWPHLQIRKP